MNNEMTQTFRPSALGRIMYAISRSVFILLIGAIIAGILEEVYPEALSNSFGQIILIILIASPILGILMAIIFPKKVTVNENEVVVSSLISKKTFSHDDYAARAHSTSWGYYGIPMVNMRYIVFHPEQGKAKKIHLHAFSKKKYSDMFNYIGNWDKHSKDAIAELESQIIDPAIIGDLNAVNNGGKQSFALVIDPKKYGNGKWAGIICLILGVFLVVCSLLVPDLSETLILGLLIGGVGLFSMTIAQKVPNNAILGAEFRPDILIITTKQGSYNYPWNIIAKVGMTPASYRGRQVRSVNLTFANNAFQGFTFGYEGNAKLNPDYETLDKYFQYYIKERMEYFYR